MSLEAPKKKIVFLTGTRADYGKIKSIMIAIEKSNLFELFVFITGMHMHAQYGETYREVIKDGYKNTFLYINQRAGMGADMDMTLANTISGFSAYASEIEPNMIVVHGDRIEALAVTIVGAMKNMLVAHIEGGEVSGTIDESIRHAITKLAHIHFVANEESKKRILQLGEREDRVHVIGSPDIDIMQSPNLPSLDDAKLRYEIPFDNFYIGMFHPVTTSYEKMASYAKAFVDAIIASGKNFILIHPNNDIGREFIVEEFARLSDYAKCRTFLSIRFEYFLTLLKHSQCIVGNSSAGIREAPIYGVPSIDIGNRQQNRYRLGKSIFHCSYDSEEIYRAINNIPNHRLETSSIFGTGQSTEQFMKIIQKDTLWTMSLQKYFIDKD